MEKITDEEKEELTYLRSLVKSLQIENDDLKERLGKYEGVVEAQEEHQNKSFAKTTFQKEQLEGEIDKLCNELKTHRLESQGKCWFFGIKGLEFDYGCIWSSSSYWKSLISANPINKQFCLFNFVFQKKANICMNCNKKVDELNLLYDCFLDNLKKEYNL